MIERRQTTRYDFGAIAEVIDLDSRDDMIGVTRDISLSGCFIRTPTPFQQGTSVIVRIRCAGRDFAATGNVTGNITKEGMGIAFVEVRPSDQAIIQQWLDPKPSDQQRPSIRSLPVTGMNELCSGHFAGESGERMIGSDRLSVSVPAEISPGQVIRLRNRLTRQERVCRVLSVASEPKGKRPKLLTIEFLESARKFWKSEDEARS